MVEIFKIYDEYMVPASDDAFDIGSSGLEFKDLYIDGIAYLDEIQLETTEKIQFRDAQIYINSTNDGYLDLYADVAIRFHGDTIFTGGNVLTTSRYTTTQIIPITDHSVFADTDGGAWTATLPAGVEGQEFNITNCGSAGLALTIACNGAETINGDATQLIYDGESVHIIYNATEKWRIY